jgi:beta-lactamase class A
MERGEGMERVSRRRLLSGVSLAVLSIVVPAPSAGAQTERLPRAPRFARPARGSGIDRQISASDDPLLALDTLLAEETGVYGLVIVDQRGNMRYSRNARLPFISASLYKLILAADILRRIEDGSLAWDQRVVLESWYFPSADNWDGAYNYDMIGAEVTITEALWATICVSSNIGAMALLQLTSGDQMNALARTLGLTSTTFATVLGQLDFWPPSATAAESPDQLALTMDLVERSSWEWDVNLTSPADMARFTYAMLNGDLVSEFVSVHMLRLLLAQEVNDRMPALLPAGTTIAHKTGNLTSIVHDSGAILTDSGPILLSMLSQAVPDELHTTRLFQSIAAMVYAELSGA